MSSATGSAPLIALKPANNFLARTQSMGGSGDLTPNSFFNQIMERTPAVVSEDSNPLNTSTSVEINPFAVQIKNRFQQQQPQNLSNLNNNVISSSTSNKIPQSSTPLFIETSFTNQFSPMPMTPMAGSWTMSPVSLYESTPSATGNGNPISSTTAESGSIAFKPGLMMNHPNGPAMPLTLTPTPSMLMRVDSDAAAVLQSISVKPEDDQYSINLQLLGTHRAEFDKAITSAGSSLPQPLTVFANTVADQPSLNLAQRSRRKQPAASSSKLKGTTITTTIHDPARALMLLDATSTTPNTTVSDAPSGVGMSGTSGGSDSETVANIVVPRKRKGHEEDETTLIKKRIRRKERCRLAAVKFRTKKREEVGILADAMKTLQNERDTLAGEVEGLKKRLIDLKMFLIAHKDCPGVTPHLPS